MRRIALVMAAMALLVSACQAASEQLAEQIAESQDGVNDVEFDADSGQVSIETDDGSFTIGGGEMPPDFPIPVPDGGDVMSVFSSDEGASVVLGYDTGRYDEIVSFYDNYTAGTGEEWNSSMNTFDSAEGETIRSANWFGGTDGRQSIGVADCIKTDGSDGRQVCVTVLTE